MNLFSNLKMFAMANKTEILMGAGSACIIAGGIFIGKGAIKAKEILDEGKEMLDEIDEVWENKDEYLRGDEYTSADMKKDKKIVHTKTSLGVIKSFMPGVSFTILGIGAMVGAVMGLKKENMALGATVIGLTNTFNMYRENVKENYGEDADRKCLYGIKEIEVEETNEKGKKKKVKKEVVTNPVGIYTRVFGPKTAAEWHPDNTYNELFIRGAMSYMTNVLVAKKILYLNEVLEYLGFEAVPEGQIVGWVYDPENKNIDSYIDFNPVYTVDEDNNPIVLIEFNVDGNVLDKMAEVMAKKKNRELEVAQYE